MVERRKNYRPWDAQQSIQQAGSPHQALPEDDLVFFLLDTVPGLDLSAFHQHYARELRGQPPFDVTMMVTLLMYAYSVGVCSSRKIAAARERNLAFRAIVGDTPPDFRTISDFLEIHQAAFRPLFLDVLRLAGEIGMVKLGNLSTDVHEDGCERLAAQGDEFRHQEQGDRANTSRNRPTAEASRADRRRTGRRAGQPTRRRTACGTEAA